MVDRAQNMMTQKKLKSKIDDADAAAADDDGEGFAN